MFESLFGAGTPLAVRFFIAFVVVFVLIGVTAWLVRRFGTDRLGAQAARGRQPRLAVIDAASVDGRRRLVLIRRDNIEHLLMIGGPSDVVVETNIVRASAAGRDTRSAATATTTAAVAAAPAPAVAATPAAATPAEPAPPRPVPLGDGNLWPLQPEPAPRAQRRAIAEETVHWPLPAEPGPRSMRPADTLAGLAAELARPGKQAEPAPAAARAAPPVEPPRPPEEENVEAPEPVAAAPEPPAPPPPMSPTDQNLAEMAQRLEAALRRPGHAAEAWPTVEARPASAPAPAVAPRREGNGGTPPRPLRPAPKPEAKPEAAKPAKPAKPAFPNLEEEMASLLGRPPGKT
jgi:flagellar biogenesis protein FliO